MARGWPSTDQLKHQKIFQELQIWIFKIFVWSTMRARLRSKFWAPAPSSLGIGGFMVAWEYLAGKLFVNGLKFEQSSLHPCWHR